MKFLIKSVRILWLLAAPAAAQAQGPILETPPDLSSAPNRACYRAILTRAPARIDLCGPDKVHPLARIRAHQVLGAKLRLAKINTAIVEAAKDNTCARKPDCAAALQ
ncbi:MAG: hypothetical protein HY053_07540, partial [Proteobacteria bacterium]|nr:hypothetical protein [Pseudomonadota bacterium]